MRLAAVALLAVGCASKPSALERADASTPSTAPLPAPAPAPAPVAARPTARAPESAPVVSNDPRISTSRGEKGGVVVLWPRIIPGAEAERKDDVASSVQNHAKALVERSLPGKPIDVRPSPQRTCARGGCDATAIGTLIMRDDAGCAVVAFVMPPGVDNPTKLVVWAGRVTLKRTEIAFREYPESEATIRDFARCTQLDLAAADAAVSEALKSVAGG